MKKVKTTLGGIEVFISSIPDHKGKDIKTSNIFIIEFSEPVNDKTVLIIDCRRGANNRCEWKINPVSLIKDVPEILQEAGRFIDEYYKKRRRTSKKIT